MERKRIQSARTEFLRDIGVPPSRPFQPDPFQLDAVESLRRGDDTLVVAPTGAGKTYIASEGITWFCEQQRRAVYTAPLKALSNAKYAEFKRKFEPRFSVGLLTGDRKIDGDADVVVATTEIYRNELYRYSENYGLVVLDEVHYLADPQRGAVWEESIILAPQSSTLLMLSASISNPDEIAEWISHVRNKKVSIIRVTERPVPLRWGFLHPSKGVVPLEGPEGRVYEDVARYYEEGEQADERFRFAKRRGAGNRGAGGRGASSRGSGRGRGGKKR